MEQKTGISNSQEAAPVQGSGGCHDLPEGSAALTISGNSSCAGRLIACSAIGRC